MAISYKNEIYRKIIHLSSIWIVFAHHHCNYQLFIKVILCLAVLVLTIDYVRHKSLWLGGLSNKMFKSILREHERNQQNSLTGASYVMLSALISYIFFEANIANLAFSVMIMADSAAALIGKKFGTNSWNNKSLMGFVAFNIAGILVMLILSQVYYLSVKFQIAAILSIVLAAFVEIYASNVRLDDNIAIVLSISIAMIIFMNMLN